jgi:hypothetical protein
VKRKLSREAHRRLRMDYHRWSTLAEIQANQIMCSCNMYIYQWSLKSSLTPVSLIWQLIWSHKIGLEDWVPVARFKDRELSQWPLKERALWDRSHCYDRSHKIGLEDWVPVARFKDRELSQWPLNELFETGLTVMTGHIRLVWRIGYLWPGSKTESNHNGPLMSSLRPVSLLWPVT